VVLCRAVAIQTPEDEALLKKFCSSLAKSGHLAFKIVIKKGKILKIKP